MKEADSHFCTRKSWRDMRIKNIYFNMPQSDWQELPDELLDSHSKRLIRLVKDSTYFSSDVYIFLNKFIVYFAYEHPYTLLLEINIFSSESHIHILLVKVTSLCFHKPRYFIMKTFTYLFSSTHFNSEPEGVAPQCAEPWPWQLHTSGPASQG